MKKLTALLLTFAFLLTSCQSGSESDRSSGAITKEPVFDRDYPNASGVAQPPQMKTPLQVTYPFAMKRAGITGSVTVAFVVNVNGKTEQVQAIRATNRDFAEQAELAVSRMVFRPAKTAEGEPVACRMVMPVEFRIQTTRFEAPR